MSALKNLISTYIAETESDVYKNVQISREISVSLEKNIDNTKNFLSLMR